MFINCKPKILLLAMLCHLFVSESYPNVSNINLKKSQTHCFFVFIPYASVYKI